MLNLQLKPEVSICLPVYNGEAFLRQAVESALAQSFGNYELLISDDCSSDGSLDIINEYAKQDKRIAWWRNETQLGKYANYNKCMERCSAAFIKPFAQDVFWNPGLLDKQIVLLKEQKTVVLVAARTALVDADGQLVTKQPLFVPDILREQKVYPSKQVVSACLNSYNLIGHPSAVMFDGRLRGLGFKTFFRYFGDFEYWLRILREGGVGIIAEPLVYSRKQESNVDFLVMDLLKNENNADFSASALLWILNDIVNLVESVSDDLAEFGFTRDQYVQRFLNFAANLCSSGTMNEDRDFMVDQSKLSLSYVAALQQCLLSALSNINEDRANSKVLINEAKIKLAETILQKLLGSISWRLTQPLRYINKFFRSGQINLLTFSRKQNCDTNDGLTEPSVNNRLANEDFSPPIQQEIYLRQLQELKDKILSSQSWRLTRLLRRASSTDEVCYCPNKSIEESANGSIKLIESTEPSSTSVRNYIHACTVDSGKDEKFEQKPYDMLLALHEASRTGAPMVGLALAQHFRQRGLRCLVVLQRGGVLEKELLESCDVLNLSRFVDKSNWLDYHLRVLLQEGLLQPGSVVFVNSAELHDLVITFKKHDLLTISLIHEFMSNYPYGARANLLTNTDLGVYSCTATLDNAKRSYAINCKSTIIPQGLLDTQFGTLPSNVGRGLMCNQFGIDKDAFVVVSCGSIDQRKGVDVFLLVANHVLRSSKNRPNIRFVWIGGDKATPYDALWWAKCDIEKTGLEEHVQFIGSQKNLEPFFVGANLFLLTSREDPFPCVLHLAQAAGLPIVAFDKSGGVEDVLAHGGGKLVPYGSVSDMAEAILEYFNNRELCIVDGSIGRTVVSTKYRMDDYVNKLLTVAQEFRGVPINVQSDVQLLAMSTHGLMGTNNVR